MTDTATSADAMIDELAPWIDELVANYEIDEWPECWRAHRGLVMEVAALHQWKMGCANGAANDLFLWHDGLDRFRDRLGRYVRKCAGGCVSARREPTDEDRNIRTAG